MEKSVMSDPPSGSLAQSEPSTSSYLTPETPTQNPSPTVQFNSLKPKGEPKLSRAPTPDSKPGEKNGVNCSKQGVKKNGTEDLNVNHQETSGVGGQGAVKKGENGSDPLAIYRGAGMKRSSSENATNFTRDLEISVDPDQHVTKPWKQRFSFRQPRRQNATDTIQVSVLNILEVIELRMGR